MHDIEAAVGAVANWAIRNDVHQETMRRAKCELPRGAVWLLAWVVRSGPARLSDVALGLGVDKSTLTPQAQRLEREGLVVRHADPLDRRAAILRATRSGRGLLNRLRTTRRAILEEVLSNWSPADRIEAAHVLSRLADVLEAAGDRRGAA